MSADTITVLHAVDGAILTKTITELEIQPYGDAKLFAVEQIAVTGIFGLGRLLNRLERDPRACVIRGNPLPGIDRARCRRLLYPRIEDDELTGETFEPAARRSIALDVDSLPTPVWNADDLARRRAAILADYAARNTGAIGLPAHLKPAADLDDEAERAVWEMDIAGDGDPAPIDPARDHELVIRAAISTLPPEFHDAHCWWQMTSGAGIKPGCRIRLWYWLDRPVSDAECKRWLADAPVDRSLYSPVQAHYTAAPRFRPKSLDPVPQRSGMWWRHAAAVSVPELPVPAPPPAPPKPIHRVLPAAGGMARRAEGYARAALVGVENAAIGGRHPTLMAVGVRLFSLANIGLLDHADVSQRLLAAAEKPLTEAERRQRCTRHGGRPSENEQAVDWARARAKVTPDLPQGFR